MAFCNSINMFVVCLCMLLHLLTASVQQLDKFSLDSVFFPYVCVFLYILYIFLCTVDFQYI